MKSGDSLCGNSICGSHFLDLGEVDPWYNARYLYSCASGDNHFVVSFPNWLQGLFGYLFDPDSITGLEQWKTGERLGGGSLG